jgi:hypothetical protein
MNYRLSFKDEIYAVEDIQLPPPAVLAHRPSGAAFSFVAPVRVPAGQRCVLRGDSVDYPLEVNSCSGFTYSLRFLVAGVFAGTAGGRDAT